MKFTTKKLVGISILGALASVLFLLEIPIVLFYKLDLSNVPVLFGTFAYGPIGGFFILLIKDLTGLLHSSTAGVGELADFLVGMVFVLVCGFIYKKERTRKAAILGMVISTLLSAVAGVILNLYILIPFFIPNNGLEVVVKMANKMSPFFDSSTKFLLLITAPFNILKGFVISVVTFILYKYLKPILIQKDNNA